MRLLFSSIALFSILTLNGQTEFPTGRKSKFKFKNSSEIVRLEDGSYVVNGQWTKGIKATQVFVKLDSKLNETGRAVEMTNGQPLPEGDTKYFTLKNGNLLITNSQFNYFTYASRFVTESYSSFEDDDYGFQNSYQMVLNPKTMEMVKVIEEGPIVAVSPDGSKVFFLQWATEQQILDENLEPIQKFNLKEGAKGYGWSPILLNDGTLLLLELREGSISLLICKNGETKSVPVSDLISVESTSIELKLCGDRILLFAVQVEDKEALGVELVQLSAEGKMLERNVLPFDADYIADHTAKFLKNGPSNLKDKSVEAHFKNLYQYKLVDIVEDQDELYLFMERVAIIKVLEEINSQTYVTYRFMYGPMVVWKMNSGFQTAWTQILPKGVSQRKKSPKFPYGTEVLISEYVNVAYSNLMDNDRHFAEVCMLSKEDGSYLMNKDWKSRSVKNGIYLNGATFIKEGKLLLVQSEIAAVGFKAPAFVVKSYRYTPR